jgi:hypothetical protein
MRRIVRYLVWSLILLLGMAAGAVLLAIEDQPLVNRTARIAPEHIERAKQIVERNDPRKLMPGEVRTVTITQEDLDLAVLYLANRYARGSSRLELRPGAVHIAMSTELPSNPAGRFLNADAVLIESPGLPRFASLEIGRLPIPAWLANWLLGRGVSKLREYEDYRLAMDCVGKLSMAAGGLNVTYQWHPELPARMRTAAIAPEDQARVHVYQVRLAELSRNPVVAGPVSLTTLMQPLFRLAGQRAKDGEAVAENRAAILVLTFYVNGRGLEALVPDARAWPRPVPHMVTLSGRGDFPKHFIVSAALAAYAGEPLADAIGVYKEVADSRGGSGFSFNDIAADRAGSRFGTLAAASPASARKLQDRLGAQVRESDIMPATYDLPEFMPEPEFLRRFGGVDAPAYRQMMAEIERRVDALPFNR